MNSDKIVCYNCFAELEQGTTVCPHCGFNPEDDKGKYPLALPYGTVLNGKYITGRVLGQGGFGVTYIASDYQTKQRVAIKEYLPDTMATRVETYTVSAYSGTRGESFQYGKECFLEEAKTLAEFIGNPNIARIYTYFEENGTAYFAMEYVEGISLQDHVKKSGGKLNWQEAEKCLLPIMDALESVHSKGIIHRDVTPDNIFITKDEIVKLLDFGAARYSLGDRSRSLDVVLKHGFAPKEQYTRHGRQGPFTDVYTVAASFYYTITGRKPPDSIDRLEEDDLIPPSSLGIDIPVGVEDAILRGMGVQPIDRFQTMTEFKRALLEQYESQPTPVQTGYPMAGQQVIPPTGQQAIPPTGQQAIPPTGQQAISPTGQQAIPPTGQQAIPPSQTVPKSETATVAMRQDVASEEESKRKKWVLPVAIGGSAVAVVLLCAVIAVLVTGHSGKKVTPSGPAGGSQVVQDDDNADNKDAESGGETNISPVNADSAYQLIGNSSSNLNNTGKIVCEEKYICFATSTEAYGLVGGWTDKGEDSFVTLVKGETSHVSTDSGSQTIYYLDKNGQACQVKFDGKDQKKIEALDGVSCSALFVTKDRFYFLKKSSDIKKDLYYADRADNSVNKIGTCASQYAIAFTGDSLYYATSKGKLMAVGADGKVKEVGVDYGTIMWLSAEGKNLCGCSEKGLWSWNGSQLVPYTGLKCNGKDIKGSIGGVNLYDGVMYFTVSASEGAELTDALYKIKLAENADAAYTVEEVYRGSAKDKFYSFSITGRFVKAKPYAFINTNRGRWMVELETGKYLGSF